MAAPLLAAYANQLLGLSLDASAGADREATPAAVASRAAALLALDAETDAEAALALLVDAALETSNPEAPLRALLAAASAADAPSDKAVLRLRA